MSCEQDSVDLPNSIPQVSAKPIQKLVDLTRHASVDLLKMSCRSDDRGIRTYLVHAQLVQSRVPQAFMTRVARSQTRASTRKYECTLLVAICTSNSFLLPHCCPICHPLKLPPSPSPPAEGVEALL